MLTYTPYTYAGGCILWDIQQKTSLRTFEFVLPPGAPGGGTYQDEVRTLGASFVNSLL